MKSGPHLPQLEKALAQKLRPNTAKNKEINKLIKKKKNTQESREDQVNRLWLICTEEYYIEVRKNEIDSDVMIWNAIWGTL